MKKFSYYREDDESLITIPSFFDNEKITFALDTGATHSVIDLTRLLLAGYDMQDAVAIPTFLAVVSSVDRCT